MGFVLDLLGAVLDFGPSALIGRWWVKRYHRGKRIFVRGFVSGLSGIPRWATCLVAHDGRLWVANEKRQSASLSPLPYPLAGAEIEECQGRLRGPKFHYRYHSDSGFVEVYPAAPAAIYLVERVLQEMTGRHDGG